MTRVVHCKKEIVLKIYIASSWKNQHAVEMLTKMWACKV